MVFLEIDEGEHKSVGYPVLCDTTRMWNICASFAPELIGRTKVLWLRVNPDTRFAIGDVKYRPSNTKRCDAVCRFIDTLEGKETDSRMQVAYAFYQMHADCSAKVLDDPDYSADVKEAVVTLTHQLSGDDVNIVLEENEI